MKRFLAIFIVIIMGLSLLLPINLFAVTDELLKNGGFESGDLEGFFLYGPDCNTDVSEDYAHSGDYGFLMSDRGGQYSTYACNIADILTENGPGEYKASFWAKLGPESAYGGDCQLVINIKSEGDTGNKYHTSKKVALTDEWQQFVFEGTIDFDLEKSFIEAYFYAQSFDAKNNAPDIILDDFSLVKTSAVNGKPVNKVELPSINLSHIDYTNVERDAETTFGAIRWDAWYTHDGKEGSVISQVERSLSPSQFHFRAPFFAEVTDDGKIIIPQYTQEIFDKEMEYAIEAGIDYFAYVWYDSDMKAARVFHTQSKYKNNVKMCACFDGNAIGKDFAREEMATLFLEDYYMTVLGGRPLMYYFADSKNLAMIKADIKYYRQLAESLGLPEPFAVVMNASPTEAKTTYADAVSVYAESGRNTYSALAESAQKRWESVYRVSGTQYVPNVTFGWQTEPRFLNPVSWTSVGKDTWAEYGTADELAAHIKYTYSYLQHPFVKNSTKANTFLAYAWNEHDEGGWLCPTIAVDENGNQLYNEDGSAKINDERIIAIKNAVAEIKAGNYVEVVLNGVSNMENTSAPSTTDAPAPQSTPTGTPEAEAQPPRKLGVFFIIGGVAVAGAIAVTVIIIIKKKGNK